MPEAIPQQLADLRRDVEDFVRQELAPLEKRLATEPEQEKAAEIAAEVRRRSQERGLYGLTLPAELGGSAAGPLTLVVVREALARANLSLSRHVLAPSGGALATAEGAARDRYLRPLLAGEIRGAFAFTEPSDARHPTTLEEEEGMLRLRGRKAYVSGFEEADFVAVVARLTGVPGAAEGGSAVVVVERGDEGLELERRFRSIDGSDHASLRFDVLLPRDRLVGSLGDAVPRALLAIGDTRLAMSADAAGLAAWAVDFVSDHLAGPHRSGQPLSSREGVRLRYADLRIAVYAARSVLYRTARLVEAGEETRNEVMATKVFVTETLGRVADQALQLVGGAALIQGHPLEQLYRRARSLRLAEGASDLLRLGVARGFFDYGAGRL